MISERTATRSILCLLANCRGDLFRRCLQWTHQKGKESILSIVVSNFLVRFFIIDRITRGKSSWKIHVEYTHKLIDNIEKVSIFSICANI